MTVNVVNAQSSQSGHAISNASVTAAPTSSAAASSTSLDAYEAFSFQIPYNQSEECDIYGPTCQTGSITVGVGLTTATSTTTMPCSKYLSLQSAYLAAFNPFPGETHDFWPVDWQSGFGHSPECKSYASAFSHSQPYTFSDCGAKNTIVPALEYGLILPSGIPPGVMRQIPYQVFSCCGNCSFNTPQVRLYYFPDKDFTGCGGNGTSGAANASSAANSWDLAPTAIRGGGSIAITNGHTL